MKHGIAGTAAVAVAIGALSAHAAAKKVEEITCEEFLAMDPENQNRIAYWVDRYAEGRNESAATTVALDKFDQPIGAVVADCKATPKETLWQKIKRHF